MKKTAHKRAKFKKDFKLNNFKLGAFVLGLVITLVVVGKLLSIITSLSLPYAPDSHEKNKTYWDGRATLNLVIKTDEVYLLTFNPVKKEAAVLKIPQNTYLSVPFGFGSWSIGSVYQLGQSEQPVMGAKLLKETVSNAFGLPIHGYFFIGNQGEEAINNLKSNPLLALNMLRQSKTDLSILEYWKLFWGLRSVRFDKLETVDLENSNLSSWSLRADGSRVLSLNQAKLDQFIQKQIEESKIKDDGFSIGIYNTTAHAALAERAARMVNNMGGRVTFTANSPITLKRSIVLGPPSYTLTYLSQLFTLPCPKRESCQENPALPTNRAEINIFLGEDYFQEHVGTK